MIITFLCEPRTGSSNLLFWFKQNKNFSILFEPINNPDYKKFSSSDVIINDFNDINKWSYNTEHLVIKEMCEPYKDYQNLLNNSDKVIILYRENINEQIESWLMAHNIKNWGKSYVFDEKLLVDKNHDFLIEIKNEIEKYKLGNYFMISYEELYFGNGINRLIEYIDLIELTELTFPYGEKYRKNKKMI